MLGFIKRLFGIKTPNENVVATIPPPPVYPKKKREFKKIKPIKLATPLSSPSERSTENNSGDFLTSMMVAQATDSALLGTIVGGDPVGAMIGDALNDSDNNSSHDFGNGGDFGGGGASGDWDNSPSYNSNDSYDSSSSYDSYDSSSSFDSSSSD